MAAEDVRPVGSSVLGGCVCTCGPTEWALCNAAPHIVYSLFSTIDPSVSSLSRKRSQACNHFVVGFLLGLNQRRAHIHGLYSCYGHNSPLPSVTFLIITVLETHYTLKTKCVDIPLKNGDVFCNVMVIVLICL